MNTINRNLRVALALGLLLTISACAPQLKRSIDIAHDANFDDFGTYAWIDSASRYTSDVAAPTVVNPLNDRRIRSAIELELESKGYRKVDQTDADFVVGYTIGARDRVRIRQHYNDFGYRYYGYYPGFGRFRPYGRLSGFYDPIGPSTSVRLITEGTLVVDIFENTDKEAIWHGSATKRISAKNGADTLIYEAVSTLFAEFPAKEPMARAKG